ncbi:hypothetical protein [Paenibacillus sp. BAC0078]
MKKSAFLATIMFVIVLLLSPLEAIADELPRSVQSAGDESDAKNAADQVLILGDKLKYLSEKAYREGNIELSKKIHAKYYDLYLQSIKLFSLPGVPEKGSTRIQSDNARILTSEDSKFTTLLSKYESAISEFDNSVSINKVQNKKTAVANLTNYGDYPVSTVLKVDQTIISYSDITFTPEETGIYQFTYSSVIGDTVGADIWDGQQYIYGNSAYEGNKTIETVSMTQGVTYTIYFNVDYPIISNATKVPIVSLDMPIDISLNKNQFQVFKFTPARTYEYTINTLGYGGLTSYGGGASITLYQDAALKQSLDQWEDELSYELESGKTYYIKLEPLYPDQPLHMRVEIINRHEADLILNAPSDVTTDNSWGAGLEFTAPTNGTYRIFTTYYKGVKTPTEADTVLEVYTERYVLLAENDDDAPNDIRYSTITMTMNGGENYYIIIKGFGGDVVNARVTATLLDADKQVLEPNTPYDLSKPTYSICNFSFTPKQTDNYVFWTSAYNGTDTAKSDTILQLYSNAAATSLIAENDNYNNTTFSRLKVNLVAGKTYYLKLQTRGIFHTRLIAASSRDSLTPENLTWTYANADGFNIYWQAPLDSGNVKRYIIWEGNKQLGVVDGKTNYLYVKATPPSQHTIRVEVEPVAGEGNYTSKALVVNFVLPLEYVYSNGRLKYIQIKESHKIISEYVYDKNGNLLRIINY